MRAGDDTVYSEIEFTRIVLERLAEAGAVENPVVLWQEGHFGRLRYKINGFAMPDDDERLLLVASVYTGDLPPRTVTRTDLISACEQALRFYQCSRKGLHETIEPSNTDASDLARRIFEAREQITVLRVLLISDALTGLKSIDLKDAIDGTRVVVDMYGIERLHRTLGEGLSRDDIILSFLEEMGAPLPCLRASGPGADYEAFLAAVPGQVLADVYEKYGTRLLELNVRAFLGLRGRKSVNAGLALHNPRVPTQLPRLQQRHRGHRRQYRGRKHSGPRTRHCFRPRTSDRQWRPNHGQPPPCSQARSGGTRRHRSPRQDHLRGRREPRSDGCRRFPIRQQPEHGTASRFLCKRTVPCRRREKLANNTWLADGTGRWFYERARGSYGAAESKAASSAAQKRRFTVETPKDRRFSKTDLAKYLNAWNGQPHLVSFGNQKNFQFLMQSLKDEYPDGFEPDAGWFKAFIVKVILFRVAQKIVRAAKFPAYQANIATYLVAALFWRVGGRLDFDLVWRNQTVSRELAAMLETWARDIDAALRLTSGGRMPSEWAKKSECRDALAELDLALPKHLPPEIYAGN